MHLPMVCQLPVEQARGWPAGVAGTGAASRSPGICAPYFDRFFLRKASVQSSPAQSSPGHPMPGPSALVVPGPQIQPTITPTAIAGISG